MAYGTINADVIGTSVAGSNLGAGNASIMKNRIINGAMVVSQRNGTSSVSTTTGQANWSVDRWVCYVAQSSKLTMQQNAGSVTPPVGFSNYVGITSTSAYTVGSTDYFQFQQAIEGFNFADLGWGTANAKTVTLSFWVQSSLTGTFGGALRNRLENRSYPFSYTVSTANTWTQVSITIAGDTSGTWEGASNLCGVYVIFGLGMGSTLSGTANSWAGADYRSSTGATSVVGTNGATFYITGVQLEVGSSATGFEYRQYGTELALCQRYYEKSYDIGTAPATATAAGQSVTNGLYGITNTSYILINPQFKVTKRAATTISVWDYSGNSGKCVRANLGVGDTANQGFTVTSSDQSCFLGYSSGSTTATNINIQWAASAEL
jgi:hypothetical protein